MCKAADDVERGAHLVANVLDEGRLNLVGLQRMIVSAFQLLHVATTRHDGVEQQGNEKSEQNGDDCQQYHLVLAGFALYVVESQFVANTHHAVGEHHIVEGVAGSRLLFLGLVSLFPFAGIGID